MRTHEHRLKPRTRTLSFSSVHGTKCRHKQPQEPDLLCVSGIWSDAKAHPPLIPEITPAITPPLVSPRPNDFMKATGCKDLWSLAGMEATGGQIAAIARGTGCARDWQARSEDAFVVMPAARHQDGTRGRVHIQPPGRTRRQRGEPTDGSGAREPRRKPACRRGPPTLTTITGQVHRILEWAGNSVRHISRLRRR